MLLCLAAPASHTNDGKQPGVCTALCKAYTTPLLFAHKALRHSELHLEVRDVAGLTVKRTRRQANSDNKNNAAQMSMLHNRHTRNHRCF